MQVQKDYTDKPTRENTNRDIDVAISKTGHITPRDIIKALQRENRYFLFLSVFGALMLMLPFFYIVIIRGAADQTWLNVVWFFSCLIGLAFVSIAIFRMVRTNKKKQPIFSGDFTIRKGTILDTCSVYVGAGEGDDCFIKIEGMPECWIYVGTEAFDACRKGMTCYELYLSQNGEEKLFMIYVGECTFETGKIEIGAQ